MTDLTDALLAGAAQAGDTYVAARVAAAVDPIQARLDTANAAVTATTAALADAKAASADAATRSAADLATANQALATAQADDQAAHAALTAAQGQVDQLTAQIASMQSTTGGPFQLLVGNQTVSGKLSRAIVLGKITLTGGQLSDVIQVAQPDPSTYIAGIYGRLAPTKNILRNVVVLGGNLSAFANGFGGTNADIDGWFSMGTIDGLHFDLGGGTVKVRNARVTRGWVVLGDQAATGQNDGHTHGDGCQIAIGNDYDIDGLVIDGYNNSGMMISNAGGVGKVTGRLANIQVLDTPPAQINFAVQGAGSDDLSGLTLESFVGAPTSKTYGILLNPGSNLKLGASILTTTGAAATVTRK